MHEKRNEYRDIIENSYSQLEEEKEKKINELNQRVSELKEMKNNDVENNLKSNIEIFDKIIKSDIPERKNLEQILDKVIIHQDRNLEFKLLVNIDKLTYKY